MEGEGIDHERDESPGFLGVPAPVASPRLVGPDGSHEDAYAEQEDGGIEHQAAEEHQSLRFAGEAEGGDAVEHDEGQEGIAQHDEGYVDAQPGRDEHGDEGRYLWVHLSQMGDEEGEARKQESEGLRHGEASLQEAGQYGGAEGEEEHGLISVAQRDASGDVPAKSIGEGEGQGREPHEAFGPSSGCAVEALGAGTAPAVGSTGNQQAEGEYAEGEIGHEEHSGQRPAVVDEFGLQTGVGKGAHTAVRGEGTDERSVRQHQDEAYAFVGFLDGFLERRGGGGGGLHGVGVAFVVALEDIAVGVEEVREAGVFSVDMEHLAEFTAFHEDHRFVLPGVGAQEPSADDLFGGQAAEGGLSRDFHNEVAGECVEGGHAVVVYHLAQGQGIGFLAVECRKLSAG